MPPQPGSTDWGLLGCAGGKVWLNTGQAVGEQVHACRCPLPHRCCFAALRCGWCKERSSSDHAQALLSALYPLPSRCIILIFFFFFFERGWGGERKRPINPTPHH